MPAAIRFQSIPRDYAALLARWIAGAALLLAFALVALSSAARADTIVVKSAELRADEDAYVVSAEFDLAFNPTLEEAIQKGVPLYFVFEFELLRPRWYWVDEKVLALSTQYRKHGAAEPARRHHPSRLGCDRGRDRRGRARLRAPHDGRSHDQRACRPRRCPRLRVGARADRSRRLALAARRGG